MTCALKNHSSCQVEIVYWGNSESSETSVKIFFFSCNRTAVRDPGNNLLDYVPFKKIYQNTLHIVSSIS